MTDMEFSASKKEEHSSSLISEVMKNGFANFLDRTKDDDYPETFKLDEISTLEKLEDKLKKKKEVLVPRMNKKNKYVWVIKLILFAFSMLIVFAIVGYMRENSNDNFSDGARPKISFWAKIAMLVDGVLLIPLLIFTIVEEIVNQIANWKRRRNPKNKVSLEYGDKENEMNETEMDGDNLKNRCQKLIEHLNENYEPMRARYKCLCTHYVFYHFTAVFVFNILAASWFIDNLFYKTEKSLSTYIEVTRYVTSVIFPSVLLCSMVMNEIAEDKKLKF